MNETYSFSFSSRKYLLVFLLLLGKNPTKSGFTLIEMLVTTLIVGILAAVSLPNILHYQGKSREVEAKESIGTLNRAQEAFHYENRTFLTKSLTSAELNSIFNPLSVSVHSKYYSFSTTVGNTTGVTQTAKAIKPSQDWVNDYSGAVTFDPANRTYEQVACRGNQLGNTVEADISNTLPVCVGGIPLR